ncbi:MAG: response regulator [Syntrophorhabdaceae bacterium]|nr:response regulator [Syntrophorhabdaceae bacterium]MDD5243201.1 response regulator [Syntrophorhabdaceae bacterium]
MNDQVEYYKHIARETGKRYLREVRKLTKILAQKRQTEAALRSAEEKYRAIFENAMEGIFQVTPDGSFIIANPALAYMQGYDSPEELINSITDIGRQLHVNPERRLELVRLLNEEGAVHNFEAQLYRKDGSTNWVSIDARTIRNKNGETLYYEGAVEHITERKQLQSQLLQAQKIEAIGTLAGGIAHDFNNILTAIIGYCNLLQVKIDGDDPARIYADHILASAEKAAGLTQSLLAFSRKQPIELKPHKVNGIIKETEKLLRRLIPEDIYLEIIYDDDDITVMADVTHMEQVLMNMATNARDAMPQGGVFRIGTKVVTLDDEFRKIHGYGNAGTYALISVSDTGCGMDETTKKKVFDPFFTTKEVGKGTGLGLSIVYGIIKQHNGYITLESKPDRGTTFHIYLPAVKVMMEEAKPFLPIIKRGTETILIAEDDPLVRDIIKEILTESGYSVIESVDGEDAVERFIEKKHAIDLMIVDVVMPKKNGKEVYEEIRKTDRNIKVLFTSGYTRDVVIDKGVYEDTVDFVSKPISQIELLVKVREALDK